MRERERVKECARARGRATEGRRKNESDSERERENKKRQGASECRREREGESERGKTRRVRYGAAPRFERAIARAGARGQAMVLQQGEHAEIVRRAWGGETLKMLTFLASRSFLSIPASWHGRRRGKSGRTPNGARRHTLTRTLTRVSVR